MRVRPNMYYAILCESKDRVERIEIDDADSDQVVSLVLVTFQGRFDPPTDRNGQYKKNIPYTKVFVVEFDKMMKKNKTLTNGKIYNLSPTQVKERIVTALKSSQV